MDSGEGPPCLSTPFACRGTRRVQKRGASRRQRLNALAAELERAINSQLADREAGTHTVMYGYLAAEMEVPGEEVRDALLRVPGAGNNGLTIVKR